MLHWLTRNWAETGAADDPALAPVDLPVGPEQARALVEAAIRRLPRWQLAAADPASPAPVHATRTTRWWRFVDDVRVRVEATPAGSRVHARSQSRIGKGDFGQNRRNLLELLRAVRDEAAARGS